MAASSSSGMSNEQIVARFNEMRQQVSSLTAKIADLEGDCQEHTLVINTLEPMGKERQCYRMIGDVLVERTVGEALPAVTRNRDNLQQAIDQLSKQRETTVKELSAFQVKHNIRMQGQESGGEPAPSSSKASGSKQSVLAS